MCGFVAYRSCAHPIGRARIDAMAATLAHRGPDDRGVFEADEGRAALAHRRLAVLDTSPAGRQPMSDASGRFTIVHNGEVYGFRDVRRELEARGQRFRSGSDTEVIVSAWAEWGADCLPRLDGMFAFAIWDDARRELVAARDRLGIKPLYYYWDGATAILASELRALLAHPEVRAEVDPAALRDFLVYGFVPDPRSILRRVRKLPPGCRLRVADGELDVRSWWDVVFDEDHARSEARWCEELLACLDGAVADQLVSDVPLGAFLSGGVDSSAIVASMVASGPEKPSVFAVGFEEARFDERPHARRLCEALGVALTETVVRDESLAADLSLVADVHDEPFGDTSAIPTWHLCRAARRIVTVALSGDGGDENFGGYRSYARVWARAQGRSRARILLDRLLARIPGGRGPEPEDPLAYFRQRAGHWAPEQVDRLVPGREADENPFWAYDAALQEGLDPVNQVLRIGLKTVLPGRMLTKVDRASMAHSLEVRVPLLDHRLVELCARIPARLKLGGGTKVVFKRALRGRVPDDVLRRRKQGFTPPLREWLVEPSTYAALRASVEANPLVRDLFDAHELRRFLDAPSRRRPFGRRFADLVFLDRWSRRWLRVGGGA